MNIRGLHSALILVIILSLLTSSVSYVYAPNYILYYKNVGILSPHVSNSSSLTQFISLLKKYNLFRHEPKFIKGISNKNDISDIDILIIGIYPDDILLNKTSIEIIGSWFDQGGKLIIFFNPLRVERYDKVYGKYNLLLKRLGSPIRIQPIGFSLNVTSDIFNPPMNKMGEYTFEINNITCIYHVTGKYEIGSTSIFKVNDPATHILTYVDEEGSLYPLSIIEIVHVYSDLFTKVYSKIFLSMDNPLLKGWYRYDNSKLFIETLSWGINPYTQLNNNGLVMITVLIAIGLSPYLYLIYFERKGKRNG